MGKADYISNGCGYRADEQGRVFQKNAPNALVQNLFQGVFARQDTFSIRQFIRQKGGRVLYIKYDLALSEALSPSIPC